VLLPHCLKKRKERRDIMDKGLKKLLKKEYKSNSFGTYRPRTIWEDNCNLIESITLQLEDKYHNNIYAAQAAWILWDTVSCKECNKCTRGREE